MLEIKNVSVRYGSAQVLHSVNLTVPDGKIVALLGNNGAGKSTLLRAISGTIRRHQGALVSGTIELDGRRIDGSSPAAIVRSGVVQVPEGRRVFGRMSVEENLRVSGAVVRDRAKRDQLRATVSELFPVLDERLGAPAGLLSGGQQQMLAIGRALMADPAVLLLDEPSLGLAPKVIADIADTVRRVNALGTSVLVVEQNADVALGLAEYGYVLEQGAVVMEAPSQELASDEQLRAVYLGGNVVSA